MKVKTKVYGAYGSNMNLEQMRNRCPNAKVIGTGVLKDYKLTFRGSYKGVANVEHCQGYSVPIVLWDITANCEQALDIYEGYPTLYIKKEVMIDTGKGTQNAMIYVMAEEYTNMVASPTEYYFNAIARGYTDNGIGLKPLQIAYSQCLTELK